MGDESTEEASVRVSREWLEEEEERVALWSESSAEEDELFVIVEPVDTLR